MMYAATRCGGFPELQEMREIFTSRFGKEFVARATELRNNCGVNLNVFNDLPAISILTFYFGCEELKGC